MPQKVNVGTKEFYKLLIETIILRIPVRLRFTSAGFYIRSKIFLFFFLSYVYRIYISTLFKSEVKFLFVTKAPAVVSHRENCTERFSNGSTEELYRQQNFLLWSKHGYLYSRGMAIRI